VKINKGCKHLSLKMATVGMAVEIVNMIFCNLNSQASPTEETDALQASLPDPNGIRLFFL
jgi:hypothetical protein